ncbi:MAG: hypothetical protein AB1589_38930, partial [Cyanobacteriota bacterium]
DSSSRRWVGDLLRLPVSVVSVPVFFGEFSFTNGYSRSTGNEFIASSRITFSSNIFRELQDF